MARNRDPFTQALSSLRERLQSGDLVGGAPIIVQDEAARLRLSTTPVREALARLSGEGLVERAAAGGYVAIRLDATAARDRYAMEAQYVRIAVELSRLALGGLPPLALAGAETGAGPAVARLFETIIRSSANQVLYEAFERVAGQLHRVRRLEPHLFPDLGEEALRLQAAYSGGGDAFDRTCAAYYERRVRAAGALSALVTAHGDQPRKPWTDEESGMGQ